MYCCTVNDMKKSLVKLRKPLNYTFTLLMAAENPSLNFKNPLLNYAFTLLMAAENLLLSLKNPYSTTLHGSMAKSLPYLSDSFLI